MSEFNDDLTFLLNKHSRENNSDTPDWILSEYMQHCLHAFEQATIHREQYYGKMTAEANDSTEG